MDISVTSKYSFPNKTSNIFSTSNLMEEAFWLTYENYSSMKKNSMPALLLTQLPLFNFNACEVTKVYSGNEASSDSSGSPHHFPGCREGAQEHISVTLHSWQRANSGGLQAGVQLWHEWVAGLFNILEEQTQPEQPKLLFGSIIHLFLKNTHR